MGKNIAVSASMITHQCVILDYCLEATVRSMLDLCEDVYINDGGSTDGTLDILYSLQTECGADRVKIFERQWRHDRRMWADEKNFILDKVPMSNYNVCIDADEVIHQDDISKIKTLCDGVNQAIAFKVIHFYGRPTRYIEGAAWYPQHTRLWKRSTGIKIIHHAKGCADDVCWPNGAPAHLIGFTLCDAKIYHYGNCRSPKALGIKAKKADDLYQYSTQYKNGQLAEPRSFTYAFDTIGHKEFKGEHPKYIKEWYEKHKLQDTSYDVGDHQENKLWCF